MDCARKYRRTLYDMGSKLSWQGVLVWDDAYLISTLNSDRGHQVLDDDKHIFI